MRVQSELEAELTEKNMELDARGKRMRNTNL